MSDQPNREPQHHEPQAADTNPASPQGGGDKDTNDLSGIKQVQKMGMQEKADQVDKLPDSVTGANSGIERNRR
ncbi:hypothetical protein EHF33_01555 [Deinococcus psychrotolerans]|uniref:Uncharacterized protein n=1 Tax=Deinococcus psychrotolerans TaxID=2489213 RepID=A0A3G8Y8A2_9DEIO|nr:hypothetical protein [Deinococcus psychrotolerans]AZI41602.1 hypothetical protein EHF33_01555 [Deinococcus psychrotolerans]